MKVKKTFRLSEDIIELIDNRDQRKYPSREFFLESAVRNFSEKKANHIEEMLELILSMTEKNEKIGIQIFQKLQKWKQRKYRKRHTQILKWTLLIVCSKKGEKHMDLKKWNSQIDKINQECQVLDDKIQKLQKKKKVKEEEMKKLKDCLANELSAIVLQTYGVMNDEKLKHFQDLMEKEKLQLEPETSATQKFEDELNDYANEII